MKFNLPYIEYRNKQNNYCFCFQSLLFFHAYTITPASLMEETVFFLFYSSSIFFSFLILFSPIISGMVMLKSSRTHSNKFESGNTDEFTVEAVNIGELKKIK